MPPYNRVHDPVLVASMKLDLAGLPDWSPILLDLPIGTGVKGGIARKILKVVSGLKRHHPDFASELNGDGDIDILVTTTEVTPSARRQLRREFTGIKLGNMVTTAKDIEVSDSLSKYFLTRDVTMNEALVFRVSKDEFVLYYTQAAAQDVVEGLIRPSMHTLHTVYTQVWEFGGRNVIVPCPSPLARCIIRFLKGHGTQYAIEPAVWDYYRKRGLELRDFFRIMRNFVNDNEKFQRCAEHLVALGLLHPNIDPNRLWGLAMSDMNERLARHGRRLTFAEIGVDETEDWIARKESEYEAWLLKRRTQVSLGYPVESDKSAPIYFSGGITNYPVFYHDASERIVEEIGQGRWKMTERFDLSELGWPSAPARRSMTFSPIFTATAPPRRNFISSFARGLVRGLVHSVSVAAR